MGRGWQEGPWEAGDWEIWSGFPLRVSTPTPWRFRAPQARQRNPFPLPRAITLENTLVILSTVAPDAGRYYVQAVNDKNGDNKTSQPITLTVESKYAQGRDQSRSGSLNLGNGAPGDHWEDGVAEEGDREARGRPGGAFPRRTRHSRARGAWAEKEQLNAGACSHDMPEILHR